jgi:hypothetical protein
VEAADAMLFYDFHTLLACLYGDQVVAIHGAISIIHTEI